MMVGVGGGSHTPILMYKLTPNDLPLLARPSYSRESLSLRWFRLAVK